jgi:hypothetical protein
MASVAEIWRVCGEANTALVSSLASNPDLLGQLGVLWANVERLHAAHTAALDASASALRITRDECMTLRQAARAAHDASVSNLQQAAAAAEESRVLRDGTEAALANQLDVLGREAGKWKAEYAEQMQVLVTGTVRQAREAARLSHEAALDAALARLAQSYKEQLSKADASLAELQFYLAAAVQDRDAATAALRGMQAGRDAAAAEAASLRAELKSTQVALRVSEQRAHELRTELRYRDGSAQLARRIEEDMARLAISRHSVAISQKRQ